MAKIANAAPTRADDVAVFLDAVYERKLEDAERLAAHIETTHGEIRLGRENPWDRDDGGAGGEGWQGRWISIDGTATTELMQMSWYTLRSDAARDRLLRPYLLVLAASDFGTDWDQPDWSDTCAAIVVLLDGRFVAWESFFEASGTGFHPNPVGGTADVGFAATLDAALGYLSEKARGTLRLEASAPSRPAR